MNSDLTTLGKIYSETAQRLDLLARRVAEGRDVDAAAEFCKWLGFSGILRLLEMNTNQETRPFKIDGANLRWKCEELLAACMKHYRTNDNNPSFERDEFLSLHEKIDRMAGYLSRLSVAPAVAVNPPLVPDEPVHDLEISSRQDDARQKRNAERQEAVNG